MTAPLTVNQAAAAFAGYGRHAVVTGATQGAGRATALALAWAGATVVAVHADEDEAAASLARELKETGGDHRLVHADVTRPDGVDTLVDACREHLASVQVVVATSGTPDRVPLRELTPRQWRYALDTALTGAALVTQGLAPLLTRGASVVNIGATVATKGEPGASAHAAATAGLIGLTRSLAKELGPDGVRVNLVAAGTRVSPEHVAAVALFLAGDSAAGVNGETVVVDGGE